MIEFGFPIKTENYNALFEATRVKNRLVELCMLNCFEQMHVKVTHLFLFQRQVIETIIDHAAKDGLKALKDVRSTNEWVKIKSSQTSISKLIILGRVKCFETSVLYVKSNAFSKILYFSDHATTPMRELIKYHPNQAMKVLDNIKRWVRLFTLYYKINFLQNFSQDGRKQREKMGCRVSWRHI